MSVIAITIAKPHLGKRATMESRARQLGGIYARHGASIKLSNIVSGPNTGCIALLRAYSDFRAASKAFQAINSDPAYIEFWREREANPSGDLVIGRNILRSIYGAPQWGTHPVSLNRTYELARNKVADAVKILGQVEKIVSKADVNVVGLLPVTGEDLSRMIVAYQFRSPDHFGEAIDTVGTSEAFQSLVSKATAIGTLRSAVLMTPL